MEHSCSLFCSRAMSLPFEIPAVRRALLRWYRRHARDLPWRRSRTPYTVWISEIMLQQTQVATAAPHFERFIARFPDVATLAGADISDVLKAWEGLGYYGRARNLHRAAKAVMQKHSGELPHSVEELRSLPGIGPYTAGAIASIAFGEAEPTLDGNIIRVLCRLARERRRPTLAATRKRLWRIAHELVPPRTAGEFNEALMDLGATVCTPRLPDCGHCPLRRHCLAFKAGEQESLPKVPKRRKTPHYDVGIAVILRGRRVLIDQRPLDVPLGGGLWEFPGGKRHDGETIEECVVREAKEELGLKVRTEKPLCTVRHAYSHFRVTLHARVCRVVSGRARPHASQAIRWVTLDELDDYAFPAGSHKIIAALRREMEGR